MSLIQRLSLRTIRVLSGTLVGLAILGAAAVLAGATLWRRLDPGRAAGSVWPIPVAEVRLAESFAPDRRSARAFLADGNEMPAEPATGTAAQRYRLAGTFVPWDAPLHVRTRKAILDDLETRRQHLVAEGDAVGGLRVVRILPDRVRVVFNGRDEDLRLAFADPAASPGADVDAATAALESGEGEPIRYGRRIAENQWVIERDALMEYYHEMLDDPLRIAQIYRSFEPVRDAEGRIGGYRLNIRGEAGFLDAVGLRQDDEVRAVNSLPMTRQSRAEYFIGEFVRDDLDTVVIDIEREGEARKLIYRIQ